MHTQLHAQVYGYTPINIPAYSIDAIFNLTNFFKSFLENVYI